MPYKSIRDLPKAVRDALPAEAQRQFLEVVNSQEEAGMSTERSFASAWAVIKRRWRKNKEGRWVKKPSANTLLHAHADVDALLRRETLDDREYLIVPVVPIVAGVLNNALILGEEIGKFVEAWNGIPVPIGHPMEDGGAVSANTPQRVTASIGRFWNAKYANGRLTGELWIDIVKAEESGADGQEVLRRLEAGEPLEVSTAFWAETEEATGSYNGKPYTGIHRHLRPDHLAVLPHAIGACCWDDGCGAPRINTSPALTIHGGLPMAHADITDLERRSFLQLAREVLRDMFRRGLTSTTDTTPLQDHMTDADLRENLQSMLHAEYGQEYYCYLEAVEGDRCIYRYKNDLMAQTFTTQEDGTVTFTGEPYRVQRNTTFTPVVNAADPATDDDEEQPEPASEELPDAEEDVEDVPEPADPDAEPPDPPAEETSMPTTAEQAAITSRVQQLIAHTHTAWQDGDTATLSHLSIASLDALLTEAEKRRQSGQPPVTECAKPAPPQTMEEYLTAAPPEIRDTLNKAVARDRQHREHLLATLQGNEQCAFTAEELHTFSTEHLEKLAKTLMPAEYAGQGSPVVRQAPADSGVPPVPDTLGRVVELQDKRLRRTA